MKARKTLNDDETTRQRQRTRFFVAMVPQSAYCAFTARFKHKVTHTMRIIPDIWQYLQKLDQHVEEVFIPALIDGPNNIGMKQLSLPVKLGGVRIVLFADIAKTEHQNSRNIIESLTKLHLEQFTEYNIIGKE